MTATQNFNTFLDVNGLNVVLVNHYQVSGSDEDTYSWHYELMHDDEIWNEDSWGQLPQNTRLSKISKDEISLGVEGLLMENKRFHLWNTSTDDTTRITHD